MSRSVFLATIEQRFHSWGKVSLFSVEGNLFFQHRERGPYLNSGENNIGPDKRDYGCGIGTLQRRPEITLICRKILSRPGIFIFPFSPPDLMGIICICDTARLKSRFDLFKFALERFIFSAEQIRTKQTLSKPDFQLHHTH